MTVNDPVPAAARGEAWGIWGGTDLACVPGGNR